jgi:hypothetical protein
MCNTATSTADLVEPKTSLASARDDEVNLGDDGGDRDLDIFGSFAHKFDRFDAQDDESGVDNVAKSYGQPCGIPTNIPRTNRPGQQ